MGFCPHSALPPSLDAAAPSGAALRSGSSMEDMSSGYGAHIDADATPGHPQEPDSDRRSIEGGGSAAIPTIHTE
eukprot:6114509-Pyramimonas_sp.AAC.1